ncbi:malonyl-CoA O-methyltransferase [Luteibacter rhizovicinus]|uniref:Malonyl-CoA O-methyltransferase n=1 Tax=Luteibacter rhizovicinus TaxID=242606 RepID=A0A4V2W4Z7_9GAMM|nr:class I SAM-dependent methyltransferase [Luteibacter rhizovicinus]TCV97809.1 malonyl-CoA O-methyltransferase [Luteibacter rhizovicinus]
MLSVPMLEPVDAYALWADSYPPHAHNPVMLAEERAMLSLMPRQLHGRSVLDAGCGSGRYVLHALDRGATHVTGVDLSPPMLERARKALAARSAVANVALRQGSLTSLPIPDGFADLTVCGLVVGHLDHLQQALGELRRVTRPGGRLLCSDVHPIGHALGWQRDFRHGGQRYAVRHTQHLYSHWHEACAALRLAIERIVEPMLNPADIPPAAHFDSAALEVPVALVFQLRRLP